MKAMQICAVLYLIVGFNQASVRIRREYGVYNAELGSGGLDSKQRPNDEMGNGNIGSNREINYEIQGVGNIRNGGSNLGTIIVSGKSEHNSRREFGVTESSNSFGLNFSSDDSLPSKSATVHQESTKTFNSSTLTSAGVQFGLKVSSSGSIIYGANMSSNSDMSSHEASSTRLENIENTLNGNRNKLTVFEFSGGVATSSQNYTNSIQKGSFGISEARSIGLESNAGNNINKNSYFNTSNASILGHQSTNSLNTNQSVLNNNEFSNSKITNDNVGYGKYSVGDQNSNNNKRRITLTTSLLKSNSFKGNKISDSVLGSNGRNGIIVGTHDTNTRQTSTGLDVSGSFNKESITTSDRISKNGVRNLEYQGSGVNGINLKNHATSQIITGNNRQGSIENSMVFNIHNGNLKSSNSDVSKGVGGFVVNHNHQYRNTTNQGENIRNSANLAASGNSELIKTARIPLNKILLEYSINRHDGLGTGGYFNINASQSNDRHGTSRTNDNGVNDNKFNNNGLPKNANGHFTTAGSASNAGIQTSGKREYSVNETPKGISSNNNFGNTQSFGSVFGNSKSHQEGVVQRTTQTIDFWDTKEGDKSHQGFDEPYGGKIDTGAIKIIKKGDSVSQSHDSHFMVSKEQRANNGVQGRYETNNEGHGKHLSYSESRTGQWKSSGENTGDYGFKSYSEGSKNVGSHQVISKTYRNSVGGSDHSKNHRGSSEQHKSQFGGNKNYESQWLSENGAYRRNLDTTERYKSHLDGNEIYNSQHHSSGAQKTQSNGNIGSEIHLKVNKGHRGSSNNHERYGINEVHGNDWGYFSHRRGVKDHDSIAHSYNVRVDDNSVNPNININNDNFKDNKYGNHMQETLNNFGSYSQNAATYTANEAQSSHQGSNGKHNSHWGDIRQLTTNAKFGSQLSSSKVQDQHWESSSGNKAQFNSNETKECQCNTNVMFENQLQYSERRMNGSEEQSGNKNHKSNWRHSNHDKNVNGQAVDDFHIHNNERSNYEDNKYGNHNVGTNIHASNERDQNQWHSNKAHRINCGDDIYHGSQASVSNTYNNQWSDHDTHHNPLPNGESYRTHSIGSEYSVRNLNGKENHKTLSTNESNRRENYESHQININDHKDHIRDNGGQEKISTGTIVDGNLLDSIGITKRNHQTSNRGYISHSDGRKDQDSQRDTSESYVRKVGENQRSESPGMLLPGSEGQGSHWGSIGVYGSHSSSDEGYRRNRDSTEGQSRHSGISELHASHWSGSIGYVKHWDNTGRHEGHESGSAAYTNHWANSRGHGSHSSGVVGYLSHWGVRGRQENSHSSNSTGHVNH